MSDASLTCEFQYSSPRHQAETAICGIWAFLATEVVFFGALFLAWIYCRYWDQPGFDAGGQQTEFAIGLANTAILIASSFVYSMGVAFIEAGNSRRLIQCCAVALLLGIAFLILKFGIEWRDDFAKHLFPGPSFAIHGPLGGGAKLFYSFYFFGTAIHGLHMLIGVVLVSWIIMRAWRQQFSAHYYTPVSVVGLYWSFVDMVWLILFPLIYLVGRA
jgi:cytochrome c oxidase subunit III